jgi:glycosyltransferase involved in cell wall biosynthesis
VKIAIIHEVSYLHKPVYEYQDFAERLAAQGHQVTVIDFDESSHGPLTRKRVSKTGLASVELLSLPHLPIPILGILLARFRFKIKFKALLKRQSFDAVLLYSVFINGTSAVDLCNQFNIPVIYRLIDAYHRLRSNAFESWILRHGEIQIYRKSSAILATNLQMQLYVDQLAGPVHAPCTILDHGVDTNHFQSHSPSKELQKSLGVNQDSIVGIFLGTTYSFSRLDQMIARMQWIRQYTPNFVLLIVGSGELDEAIKKAIVIHDAQDCVFACGMIDYAHLPSYLSLASIALCPFEINDITREIIPIKILQYLASSLPVVCTPMPDVMQHFPEGASGVYYSPNDNLESFVHCMTEALSSISLKEAGVKARAFVHKKYSINATLLKLEAVLSNPKIVIASN